LELSLCAPLAGIWHNVPELGDRAHSRTRWMRGGEKCFPAMWRLEGEVVLCPVLRGLYENCP
jgi:hypothetical protein